MTRSRRRRRWHRTLLVGVSAGCLFLTGCAPEWSSSSLGLPVEHDPVSSEDTAPRIGPTRPDADDHIESDGMSEARSDARDAADADIPDPGVTNRNDPGEAENEIEEPVEPLSSGSEGARVRAIQQALADRGYAPGEIDGRFDSELEQAVWAYQALHGHEKDGIVDAELERGILARPEPQMLDPAAGPTHTEVDMTR